jgi:hypothetical protein
VSVLYALFFFFFFAEDRMGSRSLCLDQAGVISREHVPRVHAHASDHALPDRLTDRNGLLRRGKRNLYVSRNCTFIIACRGWQRIAQLRAKHRLAFGSFPFSPFYPRPPFFVASCGK